MDNLQPTDIHVKGHRIRLTGLRMEGDNYPVND
jgi:hypothetical protein